MFGEIGVELLIILALVLANGFFSGSELAIVSARRSRLEQQAQQGNKAAGQALALSEDPDRSLAIVQVGITLIGTFAAAFGGARLGDVLAAWFSSVPAVASYAEPLALTIVVLFITYLSLVLGELVPKRLALRHAERIATFAAPVMAFLSIIARPIVALLTASVSAVLFLIGQRKTIETTVTEEDIIYMVREGEQGGMVEKAEAQFIHRVFRFTDLPVRAVMTPRRDIVAVEMSTPLPQIIETFTKGGHSRLPMFRGELDEVVGVLHALDLLPLLRGQEGTIDLTEVLRPATFVTGNLHIDGLLTTFQEKRTHIALVVDEYGQVDGMLTMQDVLEELVGEIRDEHRADEESTFVQREDGSWLIDGAAAYSAVVRELGLPPGSGQDRRLFVTLAGMILARLGRIPSVGDKVIEDPYEFEVIDMDGHRVDKVMAVRVGEEPADAASPR